MIICLCLCLKGKEPGRKRTKKPRIEQAKGHLSNYSSRAIVPTTSSNNVSNSAANSNTATPRNDQISTIPTSSNQSTTVLKGKSQEYAFEVLKNIVLVPDKIVEIMDGKLKIAENNLIVEPSKLLAKTYYVYNQFLKVSASSATFKSFFSSEANMLFESTLNTYKINIDCAKCSIRFISIDSCKICSLCYKVVHFDCSDKEKSTKRWKCLNCF
jgi:hypothetical protein